MGDMNFPDPNTTTEHDGYEWDGEKWIKQGSSGVSDWADIENKPTEFPPEDHTHEIAEVNGLQDELDSMGSGGSDSLYKEEFTLISEYEFDHEQVSNIVFTDLDGSYDQHILVYTHLTFTDKDDDSIFIDVNPRLELGQDNFNSGGKSNIATGSNGRSNWATNGWDGEIDTNNGRPFCNTSFVNGKTRIMNIGRPKRVSFITEYISMAPHGNYGYQSGYCLPTTVEYNALKMYLTSNNTTGHIALYGVKRI